MLITKSQLYKSQESLNSDPIFGGSNKKNEIHFLLPIENRFFIEIFTIIAMKQLKSAYLHDLVAFVIFEFV